MLLGDASAVFELDSRSPARDFALPDGKMTGAVDGSSDGAVDGSSDGAVLAL